MALTCADGFVLNGHLFAPSGAAAGTVIVNSATGVLARFYHPYARFLAESGFAVLTYDYRGIGLSRPRRLRGFKAGWREWGEQDVEAAIAFARSRDPDGALAIVGHSIGGVLVGFAASAPRLDRILTVGAQHAYWRDFAAAQRLRLVLRWNVAMPALTALFGYFPGRRLGWVEDLPAGVARQWAFMRADLGANFPPAEGDAVRSRFAAVRAQILAVSMTDDALGTEPAIRRTLAYFRSADRRVAMLTPELLGHPEVGHFDLFRANHRADFWSGSLAWLRDGRVAWPSTAMVSPQDHTK